MEFEAREDASAAAVVAPYHVGARARGAVVGDGVAAHYIGIVPGRAFQFVPRVVREAVAVLVLHDPHDARLARPLEGVALYGQLVALRTVDAVVEAHDERAAESSQRETRLGVFECFPRMGAGLLHRGGGVAELHELSRSGQERVDGIAGRAACGRGGPVPRFRRMHRDRELPPEALAALVHGYCFERVGCGLAAGAEHIFALRAALHLGAVERPDEFCSRLVAQRHGPYGERAACRHTELRAVEFPAEGQLLLAAYARTANSTCSVPSSRRCGEAQRVG